MRKNTYFIPTIIAKTCLSQQQSEVQIQSSTDSSKITLLQHKSFDMGFNLQDIITDFDFDKKMSYSVQRLVQKSFKRRHAAQKKQDSSKRGAYKIISVNIRGKAKDRALMLKRMKEWRTKVNNMSIDIIFLQETHVHSHEQSIGLQNMWIRGWGLNAQSTSRQWSWWSVGDSNTAGVAILVNPRTSLTGLHMSLNIELSNRCIALTADQFSMINIYAPATSKEEREVFYRQLQQKIIPQDKGTQLIVGGDFNCCLRPLLDRNTVPNRSSNSESEALSTLISNCNLVDAIDLLQMDMSAMTQDPDSDFDKLFTYHRSNASSRIDRFYLSSTLCSSFGQLKTWSSAIFSDHLCLEITLRNPTTIPQGFTESKIYPNKVRNTKLQHKGIQKVLEHIALALKRHQDVVKVWDIGKLLLEHVLHKIKHHDRKQQSWLQRLRRQRLRRLVPNGAYTTEMANYVLVKEKSVQEAAILIKKMNFDSFNAMTNTHSTARFYTRFKKTESYKLIQHIEGEFAGHNDSVLRTWLKRGQASSRRNTHHPGGVKKQSITRAPNLSHISPIS